MTEDIKITIKESTSIESNYKESTFFSDINETIIREAELDILTLGDDLSGIYNKSGLSSKKRKRDVNIYGCDFSVLQRGRRMLLVFFPELRLLLIKIF